MLKSKIREYLKDDLPLLIMFLVASVIECVIIFPIMTQDYINYDSSYQYALTQHSIPEIIELLPYDYSPPFYALALKLFTMAFGNSLTVMRAFSMVAVIGMFFISAFPVKTLFGKWSAGICLTITFCSTVVLNLLHEIRPTIFAMFFFMAAAVYALIAYSQQKRYSYICFTIFSVLSMYTHNISLVGVFGIYVVLLLLCLIQRDFKRLKYFFISGVVCAVLYIPWLGVILNQISNVNNHFWTAASGLTDIFQWIFTDMFASKFGQCQTAVAFAMRLCFLAVLIRHVNFKKVKQVKKLRELFTVPVEKDCYKKVGVLVLFLVVAFILLELINLVLRNLASQRYYAIIGMAAIVLVSGILGSLGNKICNIILAVALLVNNAFNIKFIKDDLKIADEHDIVSIVEEAFPDGNVSFLHTHEWSLGIMAYYFPNATHYVCDDTFTVLRTYDVFPVNVVNIGDYHDLWDYTDECIVFTNGIENEGSELVPGYQIVSDITENSMRESLGCIRLGYNVDIKSFDMTKLSR